MKYKIGTITFHWATNYGAVLQAYALQNYLISQKYDTEIIDYVPYRALMIGKLSWLKNLKFNEFKKEGKIRKFRKTELVLSNARFHNSKKLKKLVDRYDCVISGSDQVWNKGFTMKGEGRPTLSYFLDFVSPECKRISYAASFGFEIADDRYIRTIKEEIMRFSSVSVRENTGLSILKQLNIEGVVVCDPTLLLERDVYNILVEKSEKSVGKVFPYILHKEQHLAYSVVSITKSFHNDLNQGVDNDVLSVYDWLRHIRDSKVVVTNSYHAVMFALIFNTPFIAVAVEGSKMNDRIITILSEVNLLERFIDRNDESSVNELLQKSIDWEAVNRKIDSLRKRGEEFIKKSIME